MSFLYAGILTSNLSQTHHQLCLDQTAITIIWTYTIRNFISLTEKVLHKAEYYQHFCSSLIQTAGAVIIIAVQWKLIFLLFLNFW